MARQYTRGRSTAQEQSVPTRSHEGAGLESGFSLGDDRPTPATAPTRPVGAALMRYVLFLCLKPLLLTGAGCGDAVGAGAGPNAGVGTFFLRWRFAGSSHTSGSQINIEP